MYRNDNFISRFERYIAPGAGVLAAVIAVAAVTLASMMSSMHVPS